LPGQRSAIRLVQIDVTSEIKEAGGCHCSRDSTSDHRDQLARLDFTCRKERPNQIECPVLLRGKADTSSKRPEKENVFVGIRLRRAEQLLDGEPIQWVELIHHVPPPWPETPTHRHDVVPELSSLLFECRLTILHVELTRAKQASQHLSNLR
jgi:hypothetical protein